MKRNLLFFAMGVIFTGMVSYTTISYELKKSTAEVDQVQGYYIFAKSKPASEYEHLGVVNGATFGSHEFDALVEMMIKKARKDFPQGNALIFDGAIKQTHNTKVSVIKIK